MRSILRRCGGGFGFGLAVLLPLSAPPVGADAAPEPKGSGHSKGAQQQEGVFAALGGSNTAGAKHITGKGGHSRSFGLQLYEALKMEGQVHRFINGGIGGMGPMFASACSFRFMPPGTRYATIEYQPNVGYTKDDHSELAAIERLMATAVNRTAKTVVVNILQGHTQNLVASCKEGKVGCVTRNHIEWMHEEVKKLAQRYSMPVITMDYDFAEHRQYFGEDKLHIQQNGHDLVFQQALKLYKEWPSWTPKVDAKQDIDAGETLGLACSLGEELTTQMRASHGFVRKDLGEASHGPPKVALEATEPGAAVSFCVSLPPEQSEIQKRANFSTAVQKGSHSGHKYMIAVGFMQAYQGSLPLMGTAKVGCIGGCRCSCLVSERGRFNSTCIYDGLVKSGPSITNFARVGAEPLLPGQEGYVQSQVCAPKQCEVRVTNEPTAVPNGRYRVDVRALVSGLSHRTGWVNAYHLGVMRSSGSDYRLRVRA